MKKFVMLFNHFNKLPKLEFQFDEDFYMTIFGI